MTTNPGNPIEPILLGPDAGEARWWGDSLAIIKAASKTTGGQIAVVDNYAAEGAAAPLHIHHNEGEAFYVVHGALTIWVGGKSINATAGSFVYGPPGVPHTFTVTSPTARYLFITHPAGFEQFVREVSAHAEKLSLPPLAVQQAQDPDVMTTVAGKYGIEILGPPGIPT
jgi:mannose-6-phosphate isomerase-like protein (cupin superfamily)